MRHIPLAAGTSWGSPVAHLLSLHRPQLDEGVIAAGDQGGEVMVEGQATHRLVVQLQEWVQISQVIDHARNWGHQRGVCILSLHSSVRSLGQAPELDAAVEASSGHHVALAARGGAGRLVAHQRQTKVGLPALARRRQACPRGHQPRGESEVAGGAQLQNVLYLLLQLVSTGVQVPGSAAIHGAALPRAGDAPVPTLPELINVHLWRKTANDDLLSPRPLPHVKSAAEVVALLTVAFRRRRQQLPAQPAGEIPQREFGSLMLAIHPCAECQVARERVLEESCGEYGASVSAQHLAGAGYAGEGPVKVGQVAPTECCPPVGCGP